ncbi:hypothetical protein SLEP1_g11697 [Rubroshorea leprosula]|nr:hypothetical protein SLEP1_g11697 [Rubroshorea leprosula]
MRVYALDLEQVDDTIGDLAGGRYYSRDCVAAVSLGMGTNATYVDTPHSVPGWQWHGPLPKSGETIFVRLVLGMYLGEIVRRVLLKMAQETALFGDSVPPNLMIPYQLRHCGHYEEAGKNKGHRSVVTVGGGLYEHYRVFRNDLHSSVWEMLGNQLSENVIIEHSHGGSGAGALFLATSQTQESQQDS